ncbi:isocitrate lyase/PEP mutase family protein [Hoeflea poritis]|uniref:Isocitrate lyase/phosphoenolpyruvate mutase family protein n=1 Tax=Hoeflea poritis TaxID=2993659 RepID=A0ABT4VHD8_9HYPH|nr:isocitrate lyase/phosphoenolpyruvate mutase family protein [Hoeflea poritis]MDA4844014.1 isocitrate lyase/phosphoenolpyruvate mutase family protein [Hoeflea poritis]
MDRNAKFETFKALHEGEGAFVIPNPWNAGTAIILETLGFEALATTSAGLAFAMGRCDGTAAISREMALENAREIVAATKLPVSADLEGGFGDRPEDCAETIRLASEAGLVGGSIEDATGETGSPIHAFSHAVERIAAAAEAARDLPFLLTARSENFLYRRPDLDDTIRRLQAFEEAGADVLYAPGLPDLESIRLVCASVSKPVNVVMGLSGPTWSVAQLERAGVKRISVGGSFARAALGGLIRAANEVRERGTFTYAVEALPDAEARRLMESRTR